MPDKPEALNGSVFWDTDAGHRYVCEGGKWVRRADPAIQFGYGAVWARLEGSNPTHEVAALVWRAVINYQAAVDRARQENQ